MNARLVPVLALLAALVAGCSVGSDQTRTLVAHFDDVRHLAPRHAVRIADVRVGTVAAIELDGFRARVTLAIDPEHHVPVGTEAAVRQASLLGENYLELRLPDGAQDLPALPDGAPIERTETTVELEDLVQEAIGVVGALTASDVDRILEAGVTGFGGRGDQFGQLLTRTADVAESFAAQRTELTEVLEGLAELGGPLAEGREEIGAALDAAADAVEVGSRQRDRLVASLASIADASHATDEVLLEPHAARLSALLDRLPPVTATLASLDAELTETVGSLAAFGEQVALAIPERPLQIYAKLRTQSHPERSVVALVDLILALVEGAE